MPQSLISKRRAQQYQKKVNPKNKVILNAMTKEKKSPTLSEFLSNVYSKNVPTDTGKVYFRDGVSIVKSILEKKFKMKFSIEMFSNTYKQKRAGKSPMSNARCVNCFDWPAVLPVMKHFDMEDIPSFSEQLIIYKKLDKKVSYLKAYNITRDDVLRAVAKINKDILSGTFEKGLQNKNITYQSKSIHLKSVDRIALTYGIMDGYYFVQITHIGDQPGVILDDKYTLRNDINAVGKINNIGSSLDLLDVPEHAVQILNESVDDIMNRLSQKVVKRIPLSLLLLDKVLGISHSKNNPPKKGLHIEYGYTYMDSRAFKLSTLLRKLVQLYAIDKGFDVVSTHAIAWGSQIASRRAGFYEMKERKKLPVGNKFFNKHKNGSFKNSFFGSGRKEPKSHRMFREIVHKETGYMNPRQTKMLQRKCGGTIPCSVYDSNNIFGNSRVGFGIINGNIAGTHFKTLKGRKKEIGNSLLKKESRFSLHK